MAVVIETTIGDLTIDLFTEERPQTCKNFLKLCKIKYYNFCLFHSIQANFIAQTGDPTGSGVGGESIFGIVFGENSKFYEAEKLPKLKHDKCGLLSMVNCGNNMLGSQFFFTLSDDLQSLEEHCVFAEVTEGRDVLVKLNDAICDNQYRPYQDIRITHTVVLEDPFEDIPGLIIPDASPDISLIPSSNGRIAADEKINDEEGLTAAELEELKAEREAKARATILEIVGDLPDADIAPPENVLFVCKLNPVTTDDDLEIIFSRFGKVKSCEVIRDHATGDSLQYAFIEFENQRACEQAYLKMDNVLIDDRRIHVDFSQSVSKIKWRGKGRGVQYMDKEEKEWGRSPAKHSSKRDSYRDRDRDRDRSDRRREDDRRRRERDSEDSRRRERRKEEPARKRDEEKNREDDRWDDDRKKRDSREDWRKEDDRRYSSRRDDKRREDSRRRDDRRRNGSDRRERDPPRRSEYSESVKEEKVSERSRDRVESRDHSRNSSTSKTSKSKSSPAKNNKSPKLEPAPAEAAVEKPSKVETQTASAVNHEVTNSEEINDTNEVPSFEKPEKKQQSVESVKSNQPVKKKRRVRKESTSSNSSSSESSYSSSSSSSSNDRKRKAKHSLTVAKKYYRKGKLIKVVKTKKGKKSSCSESLSEESSDSDCRHKRNRRYQRKVVKVITKRKHSSDDSDSDSSSSSDSDSSRHRKRRKKSEKTVKKRKKNNHKKSKKRKHHDSSDSSDSEEEVEKKKRPNSVSKKSKSEVVD